MLGKIFREIRNTFKNNKWIYSKLKEFPERIIGHIKRVRLVPKSKHLAPEPVRALKQSRK